MYTIDIDIGGTFTDGFFSNGAQVRTRKVLTTPHDLTECFMNCVRAGSGAFDLELRDFLRHTSVARVSTTVGTNLLVQRAGPRLGLIVTEGAEKALYGRGDASVIGRYIAENMIVGVSERVSDDGRVLQAVDDEAVLAAVRRLIQDGARMIVVSFKNAWRNHANELRARTVIRERYPVHYLRSVPMQIGTEVAHVADDHARTNSAVLNAYVHTEMARRLYRAEDQLRAAGYARPLLVVHANGGNARVAKTVALNTLHSGPAAAVRGAVALSKLLGLRKVVTADMGGTSLDVSVIRDAALPMSETARAGGAEIAVPMIELEAIGAGGGSIAKVEGGALRVGPESASSAPGPVCYGKGGMEPTVTDANVLLGFIDPDFFLGGTIKLDPDSARRATERRVARPLRVNLEEACRRIRATVNANIAAEIGARLKGDDPSSFTLFAFGGGGPLHGCSIAKIVGIRRIVAFPFASVFSAFGSSTTDIRHTYSRTLGIAAAEADTVTPLLDEFRAQALLDMAGEGFPADRVRMSAELRSATAAGPRYDGIDTTGRIAIPELPADALIDSVKLVAECDVPHWTPKAQPASTVPLPAPKGRRRVSWEDEPAETPIFDSMALRPGHRIAGPAIAEAPDTSIAVDPGWSLEVDSFGNFILTREG